jgi:hypothetical protein
VAGRTEWGVLPGCGWYYGWDASAGHSVVGLTHAPANADVIRAAGAEAAFADGLNRAAIVQAVAIAKPDVIVHEMTSLSAANDLRKFDQSFALTNRLRTEGSGQSAGGGERGRDAVHCGAKLLRMASPRRIPKWLARIAAGEHFVRLMTEAGARSNAKAKRDFLLQPAHLSWRQGFLKVLSQAA